MSPVALVKNDADVAPGGASSVKPQVFAWKESVCVSSPRWSLQRWTGPKGFV